MGRGLVDKPYMKCRLIFLAILFSGHSALAGERYEYFNGVRMLGMGGAGIATVNDETALLVNPAGLGKLRDYFITIADPEVDIGSETEQIAGKDIAKVTNPQDALAMGNANLDRHLHSRAQVFPSIVIPNFGLGLFGKYEVNSEVREGSQGGANQFKYHYRNDWAGVLGTNVKLFSGILKLGANVRATNRVEVQRDDIDVNSTGLTLKSLAKEGIGVSSDVGILLTAPIMWLPTLAAVYRDVGNTKYDYQKGMFMDTAERPDTTKASLDVALAIYPIASKRVRSSWTIEYRDALNNDPLFVVDENGTMTKTKEKATRRLHGGFEYNFADAFFIRGGMNQSYWTGGLELSMMNYQFQAASYGEDIGTPDKPREDRRYVVKFAFRF